MAELNSQASNFPALPNKTHMPQLNPKYDTTLNKQSLHAAMKESLFTNVNDFKLQSKELQSDSFLREREVKDTELYAKHSKSAYSNNLANVDSNGAQAQKKCRPLALPVRSIVESQGNFGGCQMGENASALKEPQCLRDTKLKAQSTVNQFSKPAIRSTGLMIGTLNTEEANQVHLPAINQGFSVLAGRDEAAYRRELERRKQEAYARDLQKQIEYKRILARKASNDNVPLQRKDFFTQNQQATEQQKKEYRRLLKGQIAEKRERQLDSAQRTSHSALSREEEERQKKLKQQQYLQQELKKQIQEKQQMRAKEKLLEMEEAQRVCGGLKQSVSGLKVVRSNGESSTNVLEDYEPSKSTIELDSESPSKLQEDSKAEDNLFGQYQKQLEELKLERVKVQEEALAYKEQLMNERNLRMQEKPNKASILGEQLNNARSPIEKSTEELPPIHNKNYPTSQLNMNQRKSIESVHATWDMLKAKHMEEQKDNLHDSLDEIKNTTSEYVIDYPFPSHKKSSKANVDGNSIANKILNEEMSEDIAGQPKNHGIRTQEMLKEEADIVNAEDQQERSIEKMEKDSLIDLDKFMPEDETQAGLDKREDDDLLMEELKGDGEVRGSDNQENSPDERRIRPMHNFEAVYATADDPNPVMKPPFKISARKKVPKPRKVTRRNVRTRENSGSAAQDGVRRDDSLDQDSPGNEAKEMCPRKDAVGPVKFTDLRTARLERARVQCKEDALSELEKHIDFVLEANRQNEVDGGE